MAAIPDPCDQAASAEQIRLLKDAGFENLLHALADGKWHKKSIYFKNGRVNVALLARKLRRTKRFTEQLLERARRLLREANGEQEPDRAGPGVREIISIPSSLKDFSPIPPATVAA